MSTNVKTWWRRIVPSTWATRSASPTGDVVVQHPLGGSPEQLGNRLRYLQLEERALREHGRRAASALTNGHGLDMVHVYSQALMSNQVEQTKIISVIAHMDQEEKKWAQT